MDTGSSSTKHSSSTNHELGSSSTNYEPGSSSTNPKAPDHHVVDIVNMKQIGKVAEQLRMKNNASDGSSVYDPIMVSLGPYHHGNSKFDQAEKFKKICLQQFLEEGDRGLTWDELVIRCMSDETIKKVRRCYADEETLGRYKDQQLAEMMLLDACFIIRYMEICTMETESDRWSVWRNHLGAAGCCRFADRDIMVLENQIPFFVLKLLIHQKYSLTEGKELVAKFLSWILLLKLGCQSMHIPREDDEPIHLLAAFRRVLVERSATDTPEQNHEAKGCHICGFTITRTGRNESSDHYYTCGSVTDLNAKGIYFGQSSSHYFQDIQFKSRVLYGKLQLPIRHICEGTQIILSNMIAYEICPRSNATDLAVCSYVNLMKSLIQTPADVKVLEEAGVFALNRFANKEQVVHMFKSFETLDLDNKEIYDDVMHRVGKHCKNTVKTWVAYDLIQTKLRSPCTILALLAAVTFFALTCVQVYYAIHPPRDHRATP